jgi:hypothetical protein
VERLERLVVLPPSEAGGLAVTEASQCLERVEHAAVLCDARIGDQLLDLLARVDGGGAPARILIDLLR